MIKRINTLNRVGRFIELRSAAGADHDFAELNVVFASNAAGKSTLCDILRAMTLGESSYIVGRKRLDAGNDPEIVIALEGTHPQPIVRFQNGAWVNAAASPKIHIYDDRFVAENVLVGHHINVDQRRNLYELVIGAKAIALKQAFDAAEQNLNTASSAAKQAEGDLNRLIPPLDSIEEFRMVPLVTGVDQQIATSRETLASATQTQSKADAIRQRPELSAVSIAQLPTNLTEVLSSTLDQAALVAEEQIREHLHTHTTGLSLDWLGQGHKAKTGDGCPHCGQCMTGLDILNAYNAFFSGELQAQELSRSTLRTTTTQAFGEEARTQIRETITSHMTERTWWADAAGFAFTLPTDLDLATVLEAHEAAYQAIIGALDRKQADPANATTITATEQQAIDAWECMAVTLDGYNTGIQSINVTLTQKKAEAGTIDLAPLQQALASLEASKERHQQDVIDAYSAYDAAVLAKTAAQRAKEAANNALRDHANALLAQYGERINALLDLFAANFRIVCGGNDNNYVTFPGGQPSGQLVIEILGHKIASSPADAADPARPSLANTISGGDRSALALAFFLAKVEQEPGLADSIIVFDDPFHSQDRSRQSRTIERIHAITRTAKQCFVFSHDLDFARAVAPIHGIRTRTFKLDPLTDRTTLECKELDMLPSRAYEIKYTKLADFVINPADYADQLTGIALILRTILEEYLQLKFPLRWTDKDYWFGTMIGEIEGSTVGDPLFSCRGLLTDLNEVNNYSKRFHHRSTGVIADVTDARELVTYAKQTLQIIHQ
ncbi:MAG: AAA family ATPase [Akkermansiaceae bacterium]|nr:AAA family ATPase [Akkermansiaceae bacterium]